MNPAPSIFLAGPTAVGKSEVALALAARLGGEIISVDSVQVYRGLDIGTSKPSVAERARVPHHGLDVAGLDVTFSAAEFVEMARTAESAIRGRGRVVIYCGGTGLYFRALQDGLGGSPASDPRVRAELEATPLAQLLEELARRDPASYHRIDRQNRRRVVRAVEVIRLSGRPFSAQRAAWNSPRLDAARFTDAGPRPLVFTLRRGSPDLRRRIDARVEGMFEGGLVAETRRLAELGLAENRVASLAIGYRQVLDHLAGKKSLAETLVAVKQATWRLARRQMTWFRHQWQTEWVELEPDSRLDDVADGLARRYAACVASEPPVR